MHPRVLRSLILVLALLMSPAAVYGTRTVALQGEASFELPDGWEIIQSGKKELMGPKDHPVAEIAYIELMDNSGTVDEAYLKKFVQNNLKTDKTETLSDGRVYGHPAVEGPKGRQSHQWNVARRIDDKHFAALIVSAVPDHSDTEAIKTLDAVIRSVAFTFS